MQSITVDNEATDECMPPAGMQNQQANNAAMLVFIYETIRPSHEFWQCHAGHVSSHASHTHANQQAIGLLQHMDNKYQVLFCDCSKKKSPMLD